MNKDKEVEVVDFREAEVKGGKSNNFVQDKGMERW